MRVLTRQAECLKLLEAIADNFNLRVALYFYNFFYNIFKCVLLNQKISLNKGEFKIYELLRNLRR